MRYILLLLILILLTSKSYGQDWSGEVRWLYSQQDYIPDNIPEYIEFRKIGDTVVSNRNCIEIEEWFLREEDNEIDSVMLDDHVICRDDKRIYYYESGDSTFYFLYDFNLNEGDTSKSYCPYTGGYTYTRIDSIKWEEVNGEMLTVQYHNTILEMSTPCDLYWKVVEKIGSIEYLFPRYGGVDPPQGGGLICHETSDAFVYPVDNHYCDLLISTTEGTPIDLLIYPNPVRGVLSLEIKELDYYILYDIRGRQVLISDNKTIDMKNYGDGIYILRIVEGDKIRTERIVKTGS